jgi:hypothetical protein
MLHHPKRKPLSRHGNFSATEPAIAFGMTMKIGAKRLHRPGANTNAGQERPPLSQSLSAIWGAFLYEGLMTSRRNPDRARDVLLRWKDTRMALVTHSSGYLARIWNRLPACLLHLPGTDGVFEEEVVARFGELLGYHLILNGGQLPDDDEADAVIRGLIDDFLKSGSGGGVKQR